MLDIPYTSVSAFVLLMSSVMMVLALAAIQRGRIRAFRAWMLATAGLGAIFPPLINTIYALRCLGYGLDHPVLRAQVQELENLEIEDDETLRVQPCKSPVWDTAISLEALLDRPSAGGRPFGSGHLNVHAFARIDSDMNDKFGEL